MAAALVFGIPAPASADAVEDAYEAYTAGEYERASLIARGAIAADESIESLMAYKVLVLSLRDLGDVDGATEALDKLRSFDLAETDADWVAERSGELEALQADAENTTPPESTETEGETPDASAEPATELPAQAPTTHDKPKRPRFAIDIGVGGSVFAVGGWAYGGGRVEVHPGVAFPSGVQIVGGVLTVEVGTRSAPCAPQSSAETCAATLLRLRPGVGFGFPTGPLHHTVGIGAVLGVNGPGSPYDLVLPGAGIEYRLEVEPWPVSPRFRVAGEVISPLGDGGPMPGVTVGLDLVVHIRIGGG